MPRTPAKAQDTRPTPLFTGQQTAAHPGPYSRRTVWLVLALAGLIMALWLLGTPGGVLGKADAAGYAICHRIAERSFQVGGRPLPLCARCTGIYSGVMVTLGLLVAGRRGKASRFAPRRVLALMGLFVAVLGVDGVNSYLHLFPGYHGLYEPSNMLRLITGSLTGIALVNIILPVFNFTTWQRPDDRPTLNSLRELGGVVLIIAIVDALILLESPAILLIFGLLSAAGPVTVLTMVWTILFLSMTRHENTIRRPRDLALPLIAGIAITFLMLGAIDLLRFQLTGTWDGFDFSQLRTLN